jgi:hypothetical protein
MSTDVLAVTVNFHNNLIGIFKSHEFLQIDSRHLFIEDFESDFTINAYYEEVNETIEENDNTYITPR